MKNTRRFLRQSICSLLALAFLWVAMPLSGFAAGLSAIAKDEPLHTAELGTTMSQEPLFLYAEDSESRGENTKVFYASDGSKTMVFYPSAVHYVKDGKFEEIDNTLALENGRLTTKNSPVEISLPVNFGAGTPVTYTVGGHSVSFVLQSANASLAVARQPKTSEVEALLARADELVTRDSVPKFSTARNADVPAEVKKMDLSAVAEKLQEELTTPHKMYSAAEYEGVFVNTKLAFELSGTTLKENLVFSALPSETSYTYFLTTSLSATLSKSGAVLLCTDGKPVIEIAAPYMLDASGARSYDVAVVMETARDGYRLTYTPDRAWLSANERVYPVTLDPTVMEYSINKVKDNYAILDVNGNNGTAFNTAVSNLSASRSEIGAGYFSSSIKVGSLIYADLIGKLKEYSANARIVSAKLSLYQLNTACGAGRVVQVHKITSDWNTANVAEDTCRTNAAIPSYDSAVLDYYVTASTLPQDSRYFLDITRAVQEWASGHSANYGIYVDVADTDSSNSLVYWLASDQAATAGPAFIINYRDAMGVEDYWTYSSVSAGRYGTVAVNNFSGNLVSLQSICSADGLRMPVSISLAYNSALQRETAHTKVGLGWQTNFSSAMFESEEAIREQYPYYLFDSDGTKHYFYENSEGKLVDEDGLGLTLTLGAEFYTLTAKDGSFSEFYKSNGKLYRIYDTENNYVQVNYNSSGAISTVKDGAGRTYTFAYASGRLSSVTDPAGRAYTFAYSSTNRLSCVTYPDGAQTTFNYSAFSGNTVLSRITNSDGSYVSVSYSTGQLKQVTSLEYYGSDWVQMSKLSFSYASPARTVVTDLDGNRVEYQFGTFGQTVNVFYPDEALAAYYKYGATGGANKKITESSKPQAPTVNLLANPGFSNNIAGWDEVSENSGSGFTDHGSDSFADRNCLYVVKFDSSSTSVFGRKSVYGTSSGHFTLSAYVKTINVIESSTLGGARLRLTYKDANGVLQTHKSRALSGTNDWTRLSVSAFIPSGSTEITAHLIVEDAIGTAYFDAVQLEQSPVANRYNLLYNSNLESISSSVPTSWQTSPNTTGQASSTEQKYSGLRAWKISGTNGVNRTLVQRVYRTGNAGDTFVFSAFAKAMSRPNDQGFGRFSIFLEFHDSTGTTDQFEAKFNYGSTDWQYVSDVAVTTAPYTYFIFYLSYYDNANEVYFDLPQVFMDNFGSSYVYDEDGNIVSASDLAKTESTFEYSGSNELVKQNNPTGTSYEYIYAADNPHRLVSATAGGVTTTYTYGSYGNVTSARTEREEGGGEYFESSATYTANGNYTATSTDTLGNTVSYNYNAAKGTLTSVTDPKGNATSYSYNANNDRLTSVTQGDSSVSYTYANDRLATVSTGTATYTFIYDEAGNTANVKVGTRNLVTNTYDLSQGTLTSSVYGNGDEVSYDYDALGRVTAKYNDYSPLEPAFTYCYDNTGNLALVEDVENNCSTRYEYDAADRLVRVEDSSGLSVHYFYDEHNRQHKVALEVEGETVTQELVYGTGADADKVVGLKQNDTQIKSYVYDELNRVTSQTVNTTTPITTTYTYVDHPTEDGRTSALVETMQVGAEDVRRFVYDANGNIIAEYKGATQQMLFEYDAKGQLLKATNYHRVSSSQVFTYDSSGNILTKSSGAGTVTYEYTDSSWGDLLTSYDGQQITYDAIGNPLTDYYGRTFTWKNGRQLATANVDGVQMSFEYNEDGLRSAKIIDGARTEYFYQGSLLVCEKKTDAQGDLEYVLHFTYDEAGRPFSMTYDGATYYYVYDVYGNVNYIYNAVGEKIITVTYDDVHGSFFTPRYSSNTTTGRALSSTVYMLSPFLYKGYYYDNDLYLYYCGSRYYDPEIGRFINADTTDILTATPMGLTDKNLFAYCDNNPVMRADHGGDFWHIVVGAAVGALIGGISSIVGQAVSGQNINWAEVGVSAASGALTGAITAACPGMGAVATGIVHGVVGAGTHVATELVNGRTPTVAGTLAAGVTSGVLAGGTKAIGNAISSGKLEIGKIKGVRASEGYPGVRYKTNAGPAYSVELHSSHNKHTPHLQVNEWLYQFKGYEGQPYRFRSWHYEFLKPWKGVY